MPIYTNEQFTSPFSSKERVTSFGNSLITLLSPLKIECPFSNEGRTGTFHVGSSFDLLSVCLQNAKCFKGRPNIDISLNGHTEISLSKMACLLLVNSLNQTSLASAEFPPFNFQINERNVLVNLS